MNNKQQASTGNNSPVYTDIIPLMPVDHVTVYITANPAHSVLFISVMDSNPDYPAPRKVSIRYDWCTLGAAMKDFRLKTGYDLAKAIA